MKLSPKPDQVCHSITMGTRKRFSVELAPDADPGSAILYLLDQAAVFASKAKLAPRQADRLAIVVEELVSNSLRHGAGAAPIRVTVAIFDEPEGVQLQLNDDGAPFDPTRRPSFLGPDLITGGGVGLELIKAWCTPIVYTRTGGTNQLELLLPSSPR